MYCAGTVVAILVAWSSDKFKDRAWHMAGSAFVACIGWLIPLVTLNTQARYVALVLGISGLVSMVPLWPAYLISLIVNDPIEKRAGKPCDARALDGRVLIMVHHRCHRLCIGLRIYWCSHWFLRLAQLGEWPRVVCLLAPD